ncbi:diphthine--ammonia ligase [Sedimentibacter sp. MB31-C6]|uniref:Dph6-related ATP pyrophosphatase n=1 Tax=Sedimentibacter sp. MB31-C6 TaxID=3109366 RepID=UPI002DDD78AB|nr:diphthine--ammonia ligase [Sedimentibacter sp. MB36-C1]WSI05201.1 diphthine--ammonia ligase [Sedimentibacter sp. MB36-C1]
MTNKRKKFIASYSGGKDSTLAIYRAISQGLEPIELITTYNTDMKRSWFHGIPQPLLNRISKEIGIPISLILTSSDKYKENFETKLKNAKTQGVEVCVFGDIDLEEHLKWCTDRCNIAKIEAYFPLWNESRKKLVYEFIDSGFKTIITVVDTTRMPEYFLGQILTRQIADEIEKCGADICGENGEFHTFTFDGPLFNNAVKFNTGEIIKNDKYLTLPIS